MTSSVKQRSSLSKTSANDRISDSKGVRFKQLDDVTLSDLRAMPGLNFDVDMQLRALGLQDEIETPMLACFPLKNRNLSRKKLPKAQDLVWWCPDYNKQACSLSSSHQKVIKGQTRSVRHFCSVCYKNGKAKLEHPKASSACPYFQK